MTWWRALAAGSVALFVLLVGGALALLTACVPGDTPGGFCPDHGHLATALEVTAIFIGTAAPLAGAAASERSNPLWFIGGLALGLTMFGCIVLMAYGQNSLAS